MRARLADRRSVPKHSNHIRLEGSRKGKSLNHSKMMIMSRKLEPMEVARELALVADSCGLSEFDVHGIVGGAFRQVHELHLKHLDELWDAEFERLGRERSERRSGIHVQEAGGESMAKPLKEFASGSVRATIWENEREKDNQKFTTHTVRVERTYKDQNGEWQSTNGFRKSDLPNVELVVRKAFEFLTMREREPQDEVNGENPEA